MLNRKEFGKKRNEMSWANRVATTWSAIIMLFIFVPRSITVLPKERVGH